MSSIGNIKDLFNRLGKVFGSMMEQLTIRSAAQNILDQAKKALAELREIDSLLKQIQKTNSSLSKADLDRIGKNSLAVAAKYGKRSADYLNAVLEASQEGYRDAEGIAELSLALQSAGKMTAELADQYIRTASQAYGLEGNLQKLSQLLDGTAHMAEHSHASMESLAEGMSLAGPIAADLGLRADETTAALAVMISSTGENGAQAAQALQDILLYTGQISDMTSGISTEDLAAYEQACGSLNVSLRNTRDGVLSLREPVDILRDLAEAYNSLEENDPRRNDLLNAAGGDGTAIQLDALLQNWQEYEDMLNFYSHGIGSLSISAQQEASSWENSLNRLSDTWMDTIGNIADSGMVTGFINTLNGLLSMVNRITDALGSFGTAGLAAFGFLNKGRSK